MITPGLHNFTLYQGTTLRKSFTWLANNTPVNLTGYTGRCQFRTSHQDPNAALDLTTANGGVIVDGLTGKITLYATDVQTAALMADKYLYDVEIVDPTGDVSRLVYGAVTMVKEITR